MNELHYAVRHGSVSRTVVVLSSGSCDINQGTPRGITPLMLAAEFGHTSIAKILLNKGSDLFAMSDEGFTALHMCAQNGHVAVAEVLIEAGADMEAPTCRGYTPLHSATFDGHWEVARALINAGANPNSHLPDGETPLFAAAFNGHVRAMKELLRGGAKPMSTRFDALGHVDVPLDVAAGAGNSEPVRELIQQFGIEGCGGPSGGINALCQATRGQHIDVMAQLTDAGVVDKTGRVLLLAVGYAGEASVKFLLQQRKGNNAALCRYVNVCIGITPLLTAIQASRSWSPRVARMLVDAGADTTSVVRLPDAPGGKPQYTPTPMCSINRNVVQNALQKLVANGKPATEEQVHSLEGVRRLLLRVEAVHAVSWLWPSVTTPVIGCLGEVTSGGGMTTSTPLRMMLPLLKRRTEVRGLLSAAMSRWAMAWCSSL